MILQGLNGYPVNEVCLHTTATPGDWWVGKTADEMVAEVRSWHVNNRGWRDIGYHRLIHPEGDIGIGRSIYQIGAGVMNHNRGVVHIVLVPVATHNGIKEFSDYFTSQQRWALQQYLRELRDLTEITKVSGHNEYAPKECPGFRVKSHDWL